MYHKIKGLFNFQRSKELRVGVTISAVCADETQISCIIGETFRNDPDN